MISTDVSARMTQGSSPQVTATDRDGPTNNLLRYSIVGGDPRQQFSIQPRSGQISVRTALDREEVSGARRGEARQVERSTDQ